MPDKLKEMQALFAQEAKPSTTCFRWTTRRLQRAIAPRPSTTAGKTVFTYTGVNAGIPTGNAPSILNRSYTITAEVDVPQGGGDGMIVTEGGAGADMGCTCSRASRCSTTTCSCSLGDRWASEQPLRSRRASTRSCSTSSMTAPASPRAAPVC